jgi:tetratricopeptide (TPR) repeat protein
MPGSSPWNVHPSGGGHDLARAIAALEHSHQLCRDRDLPAPLAATQSYLGRAYALAGRLQEGVSFLEQAVEYSRVSLVYQRPRNLCYLGEALLLAGRPENARSIAEEALRLCRAHGQRGFEADALNVVGEIYASLGPTEMRPLEAHCHLGLAVLDRSRERPRDACEHLGVAARLFREMDMRFWLEKTEARMSLTVTAGDGMPGNDGGARRQNGDDRG